jgi:hypothetical protein
MPTTLELQGAVKLRKLMQLYLPRAMESRELLKLFPLTKVNETQLIYERRQVETGLQAARGLGGPTGPVRKPGLDQFKVSPGYYGDFYSITEQELTDLRDSGRWDDFENYDSQAARGTQHLTRRFLDRCEYSIASLITTGGFQALSAQGVVYHQDVFNIPINTPPTLFSDLTGSTPLNYIRDLIPTLELGKSVSFQKGYILCSRPTANLILKNQNAADLNGRRLQYGQTINNLEDMNEFLLSNDLPPLRVYDKGYYSDPPGSAPTFNRFLTNGMMVAVGVREDGEQLGEYRLTRAAQNEKGSPGEWYQVEDRRQKDPCQVILRAGHNGGPVAYYTEGFAAIHAADPF